MLRQYRAGVPEQQFASGGQPHIPRITHEQLGSALFFQLPNLLAQWWLGHMQLFSGPVEMEFLGDCDEEFQATKVHAIKTN
ncbi:hypothetical protein GCM10009569_32530 [Arthrobacter russicus]